MIALEEQLIENLEKALKSKDKVIKFSELAINNNICNERNRVSINPYGNRANASR